MSFIPVLITENSDSLVLFIMGLYLPDYHYFCRQFSDTIFGLSFSLQSWTMVEKPLCLGGCCLVPCYSNGWCRWLLWKSVIT